ncbi:MAG: hypothetical protein R2788_03315 [Saprospiraceae bacterium]
MAFSKTKTGELGALTLEPFTCHLNCKGSAARNGDLKNGSFTNGDQPIFWLDSNKRGIVSGVKYPPQRPIGGSGIILVGSIPEACSGQII